MRKIYSSFLFLVVVLFCGNFSFAQMVGTQIYLPGHWLESGQIARDLQRLPASLRISS